MRSGKKAAALLLCAAIAACACLAVTGNPRIFMNNRRLKQSVTALNPGQTAALAEIIPFSWDTLYIPAPYESRESIEAALGFSSGDIQASGVSEGMVHLIFADDGKVAACVLGRADALGYRFDFSSMQSRLIHPGDGIRFTVTHENGVVSLTAVP